MYYDNKTVSVFAEFYRLVAIEPEGQ